MRPSGSLAAWRPSNGARRLGVTIKDERRFRHGYCQHFLASIYIELWRRTVNRFIKSRRQQLASAPPDPRVPPPPPPPLPPPPDLLRLGHRLHSPLQSLPCRPRLPYRSRLPFRLDRPVDFPAGPILGPRGGVAARARLPRREAHRPLALVPPRLEPPAAAAPPPVRLTFYDPICSGSHGSRGSRRSRGSCRRCRKLNHESEARCRLDHSATQMEDPMVLFRGR